MYASQPAGQNSFPPITRSRSRSCARSLVTDGPLARAVHEVHKLDKSHTVHEAGASVIAETDQVEADISDDDIDDEELDTPDTDNDDDQGEDIDTPETDNDDDQGEDVQTPDTDNDDDQGAVNDSQGDDQ